MAGGKKASANGKVTKPYPVPIFMHSLSVFYEFTSDNTKGIGRLELGD